MTATDPELAGLLRGVLVTPEDDLPRLIYADRLDELGDEPCPRCGGQGFNRVAVNRHYTRFQNLACSDCGGVGQSNHNCERAEFIRVQVELARIDPIPDPDLHQQWAALRRRDRELWPQLRIDGWTCLEFPNVGMWWPDGRIEVDVKGVVRRGFVEAVSCDLATFLGGQVTCPTCSGDGYVEVGPGFADTAACLDCSGTGRTPGIAPRLFASQPVLRVTLSDRAPSPTPGGFSWSAWPGQTNTVPDIVLSDYFDYGPHPTREAAVAYLSDRLVAYGRANAEGMTHEAVCERCNGVGVARVARGEPSQGCVEILCPYCDGSGRVHKPGLPPLAGRATSSPNAS